MEEFRGPREQGAVGEKLEPSGVEGEPGGETPAVRGKVDGAAGVTQVAAKDDPADLPSKVPRFQYVDFPSLHRCIQQLSVPPLDSWLTGRSQFHSPPDQDRSASGERVPKFRYVDYPSLHHCIQQLSVPPLDSWSLALPRPGSGSQKAGHGAKLILPPAGKEDPRDGYKTESGTKYDQGTMAPSTSLDLHSATGKPSDPKLQPLPSTGGQLECRTPTHSIRGRSWSEKAGSDRPPRRPPGPKSRSSAIAANRKTASHPYACKMGQPVRRPCSDLATGPDLTQPEVEPKLIISTDSPQSFTRALPGTPPSCAFCQKSFSDTELLKIHLKNHQGEKSH